MRKPVIAVDGYSSTGKSSISKIIAQKLGIVHMDTGALYRGVTYFALKNGHIKDDSVDILALMADLEKIKLEFRNENSELILFLNDHNISREIRRHEISENVSLIAKQPEIRSFLLETQRCMAQNGGIIMDGRDIGTVVLPNADYKFFITASADERAKRRFLELQSLGETTDQLSVKENLEKRDKIDSERETAPLKKADDAVLIDNTNITKKETIDLILSYIKHF